MTTIERIIRHERAVLVATLAVVTLGCWAWIVPMARDMYGDMSGPSAWMMTDTWDAPHLLLLAAMWIVMMVGMMLPSAAPTLLIYAAARRHSGDGRGVWPVYAMALGYVSVWSAFAACCALLQGTLTARLVLSPMMTITSPLLSGVVLAAAGVYQLTPIKKACLASCAPVAFLMRHWREGALGAFRLGAKHGVSCVGCCWALMLLLFVGGVMNVSVIGALTAVALVEKLAPFGARIVRPIGILLIALGVWVVAAHLRGGSG